MRKLKFLLLAALSIIAATCLILTGCKVVGSSSVSDSGETSDMSAAMPVLQSIQLTGTEGLAFTEGQTLTLEDLQTLTVTATFDEGEPMTFDLSALEALPEGLTIDKLGATLEQGTITVTVEFTFEGVTQTAQFEIEVAEKEPELPEGTLVLEAIPEGATSVSATAKQKTATAQYLFAYGEEAFTVTAYVTDENIFTDSASVFVNDGIEVNIDKVVRQKGYTEDTLKLVADATGGMNVIFAKDDMTVVGNPATAICQLFSLDGKTVAGYVITITIPYSTTTIDKEQFDAAVCVGLNNAENANIAQFAFATEYGENYENVHTFAHVTEEGMLEANPFVEYGYMWGDGGNFAASAAWDVEGDDGDTNVISLIANDYADNYIYMTRSNKTDFYAEVKVRVTGVMKMGDGKYDGYPKFGMVVRSATTDNGFGYYVDAVSDADNGNIYSTSNVLGYNSRTNGGWDGNWSNVGTISGTSAAYTEEYITLGIYRQGGVFVLYYNGTAVKTASCAIGDEELAYVGLFSFNLNLNVKEYKLITSEEGLEPFKIVKQSVDYLFLGDSYVDTAFWYNYGNQFGDLSAANIGVGGTKVDYWQGNAKSTAARYDAKNIVIHIGVNDIDGGTTGEYTYGTLKVMLETYHELYPTANIFYITTEHNMMFKAWGKWAEYDVLNANAKALAATYDWLNIIDMASYVTEDAEGSTMHWFNGDGLHYGVDGYALWNAKICEALGIERDEVFGETGLGDLGVEGAPELVYSPGWTYENGVAHNVGESFNRIGAETQVFFNGLWASDFYAEVKLSIGDCYCPTDAYPKTGLAIRSASGTYFYCINTATGTNPGRTKEGHIIYTDNWGNIFYRPDVTDRGWGRELVLNYFYLGGVSFDHYTDNSYKTLGIAKVGTNVILFADGEAIISITNAELGEDEKVAVSIFSFNMDVYAKDAYFTTDMDEITSHFGGLTLDGELTEDCWTEEVRANTHTFGMKSDNRHVEVMGTKVNGGVALALTLYSYANTRSSLNWWENANVEFRYGNDNNTQRMLYFLGQGFKNARGFNILVTGVSDAQLVDAEHGVYKTVVEIFSPISAFPGYDENSAEINVVILGWVFDGEGWNNLMNGAGYPALTASTHGLRFERTVTAPSVTGATITASTATARVGDTVTITVDVAEGYELGTATLNGTEVTLTEGKYVFTMPDENVTFSATFLGRYSVDMTAVDGKVTADNTSPREGDTVTFTAADDIAIEKLYVNGTEVTADGQGAYKVVCASDMTVTAEWYYLIEGIRLDGKTDSEYGSGYTVAEYDDDRTITLRAVRKEGGLFILVTARMNTLVSGDAEWWKNTNFEFRLNCDGIQRFVNIDGAIGGVTKAFGKDVLIEGGKHETTFELYVEKSLIAGFNNDDITIAYAWKNLGESATIVGDNATPWTLVWNNDWLARHRGGLDVGGKDYFTGLSQYGTDPTIIKINEDGLRVGEEATKATIDGDLTEYADKASVYFEQYKGETFNKSIKVSGMAETDGLYLAFTIVHKGFSSLHTDDWAKNDNLELRINNDFNHPIMFNHGKLCLTEYWDRGAAKTVDNGNGTYTTTVELYAHTFLNKSYALQVGMNGDANGFNGWFGAIWDANYAFVTPAGVEMSLFPENNPAYNTEFTLDGKFTDPIWTDAVKTNSLTANANGATVTVMATKTGFGIVFGVTVLSSKAYNVPCQGDGNEWWHYQNFEFRLPIGAVNDQFASCPQVNGTIGGQSGFYAYEEDGKYVTCYEVFVEYWRTFREASGYFPFSVGGVYETGFVWLFGDHGTWPYHITEKGIFAN